MWVGAQDEAGWSAETEEVRNGRDRRGNRRMFIVGKCYVSRMENGKEEDGFDWKIGLLKATSLIIPLLALYIQ